MDEPDGIAIDEFQLQPSRSSTIDWRKVEHDLRGVLDGTVDIGSRIEQRIRTYARRAVAPSPRRRPGSRCSSRNDASESATMIDVRAPDAIGVLYRLAAQLSADGLDIRSAKVATLGHEVVDVFYVERPAAGDVSARSRRDDHDRPQRAPEAEPVDCSRQ